MSTAPVRALVDPPTAGRAGGSATGSAGPASWTETTLYARTVAVPDPGALIALLPDGLARGRRCAWVRQQQGLVGWGEAIRLDTSGAGRFVEAERRWLDLVANAQVGDEVQVPGTGLVAFGSFAFSTRSAAGACLVIPEVVVGRRDGVAWMTRIGTQPGDVADGGFVVAPAESPDGASAQGATTFSDGALSAPQWALAVRDAVLRIQAGSRSAYVPSLDKVVLARDLYARSSEPIDPRRLLRRLADQYERTWVFEVDGLVGATPEMLVRLERGLVTSRVLAGTIRRTGDDARDLALAASLARSSKDLEEHEYAVRSVAQALAPHCTSMAVPESPFVLHLPNVMHLASDVAGRLRNGATSLGLASALHPSAAVCGTPREVAEPVIDELEQMDRRRYAGPVGWMDASGDGEWGIALRCGELEVSDDSRMRLFAGCGIVAGSDPAAELAESDAKLLPMQAALQD